MKIMKAFAWWIPVFALGFMPMANAAPKAETAKPERVKAKTEKAKKTESKVVPMISLETRVGPTASEKKLMSALPSLVNGKMVYGTCGDAPCGKKPQAPKTPEQDRLELRSSQVRASAVGTPNPVWAPLRGSLVQGRAVRTTPMVQGRAVRTAPVVQGRASSATMSVNSCRSY